MHIRCAIVFVGLALLAVTSADAETHRSQAAKAAFARQQSCPSTHRPIAHCPGYVIDHIKPLACGGADAPSNMAWQTVAEGRAKDKWERRGCGKTVATDHPGPRQ